MSSRSILVASGEFRLRFNLLIESFAQENTSSLEGSKWLERGDDGYISSFAATLGSPNHSSSSPSEPPYPQSRPVYSRRSGP